MPKHRKADRLSPPLMILFRKAHERREYLRAGQPSSVGDTLDAAPEIKLAGRAPITEQELRQEVLRDLQSLVNTVCLESSVNLDDHPAVRRSILNYGIRDLSSKPADRADDGTLLRDLADAIRTYEPRLAPDSVRVSRVLRVDHQTHLVRLEIAADLLCEPVNVPVVFVANIEVDRSAISIARAS